jgi:hypothetical protein
METGIELEMAGAAECGCCHLSADMAGESSCSERSKILTAREADVLQKIREHGERARELRKLIEQTNAQTEGLNLKKTALDELDRLRSERVVLEEERLAAAEERMKWLGHA